MGTATALDKKLLQGGYPGFLIWTALVSGSEVTPAKSRVPWMSYSRPYRALGLNLNFLADGPGTGPEPHNRNTRNPRFEFLTFLVGSSAENDETENLLTKLCRL